MSDAVGGASLAGRARPRGGPRYHRPVCHLPVFQERGRRHRAGLPRRCRAASPGGAACQDGVTVRLGPAELGPGAVAPPGTDLVVTSPGLRPDTPLLASAAAAGLEVIGDVELAWRLRPRLPDGSSQQWLAITGTNGKTTTVRMLAAMLAAAGHRSIAAGNVGTPILDVVTDPEPYPVVAVELSSFQLYWSSTIVR